ncbi:MAG: endolytic transglycosylase MltG [Rhodospirillales bacterium]|nr:endolytic transglycosylase MltG [Rhodospirillales bacterium]
MKRIGLVCLLLCAVLALFCGVAVVWAVSVWRGPGPLETEKTVLIQRGSGLSRIAGDLEQSGVIAHETLFRAAAVLSGRQAALRAGEYLFPPGQSMETVLDRLARGDVLVRRITIPEGLTSHQIVELLRAAPGLDFPPGDIPTPPEGSLLPETYQYTYGDAPQDILDRMRVGMDRARVSLWAVRAPGLPFATVDQAVTLASIVEKETGVASERKRIAGVFVNRLRAGMKLQSDPTALYAMTKGRPQEDGTGPIGRRLLRADLDIDSPYNTYRYAGLPPGPIANPGLDAIAAAVNPERHDFLYFVADGTGGHVFSRTLAEHNANVARWRRVRAGP